MSLLEEMDIESVEEPQIKQESSIPTEEQENYRIWKKNAPSLYEYLQTSSLLWPSLTAQIFPDTEHEPISKKRSYRVLCGTFTSLTAQEKLKIMRYSLGSPKASAELYDPDSQEFQAPRDGFESLKTEQELLHFGEVNRARYMPQKIDVIASINGEGSVYIFDKTKHSSLTTLFSPQIMCQHHTSDGYGLSWNVQKEGLLLSSANDTALWDIQKYTNGENMMSPMSVFDFAANDVLWHPKHDLIFSTVDESGCVRLVDTRQNKVTLETNCGEALNTLSFSLQNSFALATGGSLGDITLFDVRALSEPVKTVKAHDGAISVVTWSYGDVPLLASGGQDDHLVKIWDFSQDSELRFVHGGHMLSVNDVAWSPSENSTLCSVGNDNSIHIWSPILKQDR